MDSRQVVEALAAVVAGIILVAVWVSIRRKRGPRVSREVAERAAMAESVSRFARILVPTRGTLESDRMVSLACKLARRDDAEVEVLYVVEVPRALPATAELPDEMRMAGAALSEADVIGRRHGVRIRGRVAKARFAGKAIVDIATREKADLVILGAPRRLDFGEFGRTVEYVFRHATCDVIIERPSVGEVPARADREVST